MNARVRDLAGKKFGRLTVKRYKGTDKARNAMWECQCDCGIKRTLRGGSLTTLNTHSCGCHRVYVSKSKASKQVECVETGEVFSSAREASRKLGLGVHRVGYAARRQTKLAGCHWRYV